VVRVALLALSESKESLRLGSLPLEELSLYDGKQYFRSGPQVQGLQVS
jgi:hypothetical protein